MPPEPSPGTSLELRGLVKHFPTSTAVDDVSLAVERGEFVTFLGPSGSGKTTTLNMIAGFTEASDGMVLLDGRDISRLPPYKRNIGMVFQHYALFPHMTTYDNVAFPLKRRKVAKRAIADMVAEALERVRLAGYEGRYPSELSGGQQQRVALARAIVFGPSLLLMDEPLGALDKALREHLQLEIRRLHRELGITFVYVTHDQEEALVLSDRIAIFNEGKLEQVGTPGDLYERPETLFVAEFVGDSNTFAGRLVRNGSFVTLVGDGFEIRGVAGSSADADARGAMVVRPERIRLRTDRASLSDDNVLRGTIREVIYLGAARKLEVVCGAQPVIVREPASALSSVSVGQEVEISWSVADSVVLASDTAPDGSR